MALLWITLGSSDQDNQSHTNFCVNLPFEFSQNPKINTSNHLLKIFFVFWYRIGSWKGQKWYQQISRCFHWLQLGYTKHISFPLSSQAKVWIQRANKYRSTAALSFLRSSLMTHKWCSCSKLRRDQNQLILSLSKCYHLNCTWVLTFSPSMFYQGPCKSDKTL